MGGGQHPSSGEPGSLANGPRADAPVVVAWHLMDPPRTEAAFAAALPLTGLDAWRIYLGLPLSGSRTPPGGDEEVIRLGYEDAVLNLQGPVTDQAAREFEPALADLRHQLDMNDPRVGVLGGSVGAAVAQLVIAEGDMRIDAAVLVSPIVQLRPTVEAMARRYDVTRAGAADRARRRGRRARRALVSPAPARRKAAVSTAGQ